MPYKLHNSAAAISPDGKGIFLFGGSLDKDDDSYKTILELQAGANWTIYDTTLQEARTEHIVIPIQ